jgi:DNA-binding transcriptional regulator YiaG
MHPPSPADIRALRTRLGQTQVEFGRTLHAAPRTVQDWEAGRRGMSTATWELAQIKAGFKNEYSAPAQPISEKIDQNRVE